MVFQRSLSRFFAFSFVGIYPNFLLQLMILVDDAGGAFPSINHSPWFGVTLADFVMPFFVFGVGVSVSLVFKVLFFFFSIIVLELFV